MASLEELKKARLEKLAQIKAAGLEAYPAESKRTHTCRQALDDFEKLASDETEVFLTGRILAIRGHGGSVFVQIEDSTNDCQLYFKKDKLGEEKYKTFQEGFDLGDFIQVSGIMFKTKKGEPTLEVADFKMLTKALAPLPEQWYGFKDAEERFRKRYLDLLMNKSVKERFVFRSHLIKSIRNFLEEKDFLGVETPMLQPLHGGAAARPFKTHLNALDMELCLRIAPELYLKRLLVGGFERVYEIGRCFRNEGMDAQHNPEFTILEFYWAYADYKDLMKLTEEMFNSILTDSKIHYRSEEIDFATPWPQIEFDQLIQEHCDIDINKASLEDLIKKAEEFKLKLSEKEKTKHKIVDELYSKICRPKIIQPTFIIHHPLNISPLAKQLAGQPEKTARFQVIVGGMELINAFSELNDPQEQARRFEEQVEAGDEEAQPYDQDFVEALEYGVPPAAGFGMGVDRLVALLTDAQSLREIILFPTMRPKE